MKNFYRFLYSVFFVNILYILFFLNAFFNKKIRIALFDRFCLWKKYKKVFSGKKIKKRIWFHVSSVGELEQAIPLMKILKEKADVDLVLTFFSPSAKKSSSRLEFLFFSNYLPIDGYFNSRKLFSIIKPDLLVFVKFDIWPNIVWEAKSRKIPSILIDATLHRKSLRYSNVLGKSFYNSIYMCLDLIATVSKSDLQRFLITSPNHKNIKILGDTRFDQVAFRAKQSKPTQKIPNCIKDLSDKMTLICGSTWEGDDKKIIEPLKMLLSEYNNLKVVLVPHEPSKKRIEYYKHKFAQHNPVCFTEIIENDLLTSQVLIIDTVGILAELYKIGSFAFIGGAFSTGVHNVMEPAIMGLPVVFGPFHYNSPEAERLVLLNSAFTGNTEEDFYSYFKLLISNPDKTKEIGKKAKSFIDENLGCALNCFNEISKLYKI